jgi:phosphoribosylglycinamide formyltransferase-1
VDLGETRFDQREVHHELEDLDRRGIRPIREMRTPERVLSWIDAEFGGTRSIEAAAGGIWIAEDDAGPLGFVAFDVRGLPYHWLRNWRNEPSVAVLGPIGIAERARGKGLGSVLVRAAMFSMRERGYRRALVPAVAANAVPFFERSANAWFVESVERERSGARYRTVVLASGHGSNFQGAIDAASAGDLPLEIVRLVVNKPGAFALERARAAGIESRTLVWQRSQESRDVYDDRVIAAVAEARPELVLLLGWMHVLPFTFVARFPETLNVHPGFLPLDPSLDSVTMPDGAVIPAYRGAHAFDDALAGSGSWAGASVHRVSPSVDRGELFARLPLHLDRAASREALEARLHAIERTVVAEAVRSWSYRQA